MRIGLDATWDLPRCPLKMRAGGRVFACFVSSWCRVNLVVRDTGAVQRLGQASMNGLEPGLSSSCISTGRVHTITVSCKARYTRSATSSAVPSSSQPRTSHALRACWRWTVGSHQTQAAWSPMNAAPTCDQRVIARRMGRCSGVSLGGCRRTGSFVSKVAIDLKNGNGST